MSRIYEALKTAQAARAKSSATDVDSLGVVVMPERRQSPRLDLHAPLTVYGHESNESPFYQEAEAVNGSASGGLIVLRAPVRKGQDLLLINDWTSIEQICRVVHVRSRDAEINEVHVAFPSPHLEFWRDTIAPCASDAAPSGEGLQKPSQDLQQGNVEPSGA